MTPLQQQFEIIRAEFPEATFEQFPSGLVVITIPDFPLPSGWSKERTVVKFVAPVGYPFAKPDCFWACADLRLNGGAMPQASTHTPVPETNTSQLWFSWHVDKWNPSRDSLLSYIRVIEARLRQVR